MDLVERLPVLADVDSGLAETLAVLTERDALISRRRALRTMGTAALMTSSLKAWGCSVIPSETGGPYPGDGTNGPNVLTQSGVVRSDIRASFGASGSTVTPGTPLTVTLQLVNAGNSCAPLAGYAIYLWHCNAGGQYSLYSAGVTGENFLRGVQVTDSSGKVTFTTIFPGCYSGRWPHIHFEIYANVQQAIAGTNAVKTSQLALPESTCREVYAQTALYPSSIANLNQISLTSDNVFGNDGGVLQIPAISGSIAAGYTATLEVGIDAGASSGTALDMDQQGLTGIWYEPATSGQGFGIEIYPDLVAAGTGFAQLSWFTFDSGTAGGADKQRWYTASGSVASGGTSASLAIYLNTGGNFNAGPITSAQQVGSGTLSFTSCDSAQLTYSFSDGSGRSGVVPLTRITPNVTCSTSSARPTNADFALSGNWYDAATSGQGFFFELNPNSPVLFFAWYTYAPNGQSAGAAGQRWYTGQTTYQAGTRTFTLPVYQTTGGIFDTNTPASQSTVQVGTATVTFASCASASLMYAFTSGTNSGLSGTIALTRVGPAAMGCVG
ncbi:MAG: intradiol ring-cleavage dioxygenase [Betaproteobacteria bacterium]|nr:MAG: intradiol ring-cleavage dioxygenase [Betaproteobacteria bacterium]